ncbi:MAG TPA: UDP-3-O-(3-hydroxymyristoyl)glucosamine N-acyltransferase [Bryobacteraceae bacterium]|jgi:UDP-3-O-[3-hydroxymyristoyl] glucosamine N-acyltransferase|nr:UDP-3-O-(3-hydroxymyristoyl)glucosamine N-acyltransferase [Bryobacteraceae bacterium]
MIGLSAGELAGQLGLQLQGDETRLIRAAAMLEDAGPGDLAFIGNPKFFAAGTASQAGCLIALADYPAAPAQTVLISPQPRAHFAQALALLYPDKELHPGIHTTAIVDPSAHVDPSAEIGAFVCIGPGVTIGPNTRIGNGCQIGASVTIGEACLLHPRVTLYERITMGARCTIHSGAVIGADGFGFEMAGGVYRKVPQVGTVKIGDHVEIGANTCIDRATLGVTLIGDGAKLDNMVHIAHNCRIGKHVVIAAQTGFAGGVVVGDYAIIGGQVGVGDKARIESKAIVGSGAGILTSKIVRAGEPVWGTPARPLRQYLAQLATLARLAKKREK